MRRPPSILSISKSCFSPILALFLLSACTALKVPDWVTGPRASAYPEDRYMIGVGQGDTRAVAEERAYAALARIFKIEITSQSKDWESYFSLERKSATQIERKLTVETMTKVSTDKVLENVKIAGAWKDPDTNIHSALAVLDRAAATTALSARIADLDAIIDRHVKESSQSSDKLLTLRQLHRAIRNTMARESLNSDLRVISGRTVNAQFSVADLTEQLQKFLSRSMVIIIEVEGDHAEAVRQGIIDALVREGLPVTMAGAGASDLLIKGAAKVWAADLPDPKFRYVRWCADFNIISPGAQRIVGTISRTGREGHLNYREASNRALSALRQEIGRAVLQSFVEQIYGGDSSDFSPPTVACPQSHSH
jgi:hypothetical protein